MHTSKYTYIYGYVYKYACINKYIVFICKATGVAIDYLKIVQGD